MSIKHRNYLKHENYDDIINTRNIYINMYIRLYMNNLNNQL